jgi:hypothetical protein
LIIFTTEIFHLLVTPFSAQTYTSNVEDAGFAPATNPERLPPGGFSLQHGFPAWFSNSGEMGVASECAERATVYEALEYMRTTFDDVAVLHSIPLEAAVDAGAWHSWRAHQKKLSPGFKVQKPSLEDGKALGPIVKEPKDWDWGDRWDSRVKRGIDNSLTNLVLFGTGITKDDLVRIMKASEALGLTDSDSIRQA